MKKFLSALAISALALAAHSASAGLVITEELDQAGSGPMSGKMPMTITASGDKVRIDVGKELSSIVDSKSGTITSLMHSQKLAMKLPEGMMETMKKQAAAQKDKPEFKATGKKETINGFACEEYDVKLKEMSFSMWVTKDVKDAKAILDQIAKISGGADPIMSAFAENGSVPGFPIRTVIDAPQSGKATLTVISIKDQDVPDSTFEIPADYKPMDMPNMSNPGGGAPAVPSEGGGGGGSFR